MSFSFFACNAAADHTFRISDNTTTTMRNARFELYL